MSLRFTPTVSCVLRVSGEDAKAYLQGQCTADLRQGNSHHALWLNRKGRVLAYTLILPQVDNTWLLVGPAVSAAELEKIVAANLIADDVTVVNESSHWQTGVLWGEGTPDAGGWTLIPTPAYGVQAWNVLAPVDAAMAWPLVSMTELDAARIAHGVPSVPADCGPNEFPQECGLEAWVSYTKGCYLGQEVMARIQSMGALRRVLRLVESAGSHLASGLELRSTDGAKVLGTTKSAAGKVGLALVSIDLAEGATLLSAAGEVRLGKVAQLGRLT